jgi:methyl-accepting chemotaxis protein
VAFGDRSARAEIFTTDEIGKLAANSNTMADKITEQITQKEKEAKLTELVNKITFRVCGSLDNEGAIRQLADEAIKQAAEINCTLNGIEHMTDSIADVASNAQKAAAIAHTASNTATEGEKAIDLTVEKIFNLCSTILALEITIGALRISAPRGWGDRKRTPTTFPDSTKICST